jgi:FtsZ-binding cell division protein ZapB
MGKLSDLLKAQVEELKRRDEELNREIGDCIKRCDKLLKELHSLNDA